MMPEKYDKPTIQIFKGPGGGEAALRLLAEGIEEEGLPWEVVSREGADATLLAFEASGASRLGVGIGIAGQDIVLHHDKLDPKKPLFKIRAGGAQETIRALGANAARLVKKMPFKSM